LRHPALTVAGVDAELVLAAVDEYSPTAADERPDAIAVFFSTVEARDRARDAVARAFPSASLTCEEVDDEDWARRSQLGLEAVTVGAITVAPAAAARHRPASGVVLIVPPSVAFGTGHHASTRLCLRALQHLDLAGTTVLDVGTGSGVLALAARLLGARRVVGVDLDQDAVDAARLNLRLNGDLEGVSFLRMDIRELTADLVGRPHVLAANLTGTLLQRAAPTLAGLVGSPGSLVLGGILSEERDAVLSAFPGTHVVWEATEDGWVGMTLRT
jgi:ribosomal protein L11 methyltransferase